MEKIIEEIEPANIQDDYINKLELLKNNNDVKKFFYHYNNLVTVYSNKNKSYYLIENSPSLLVYAQPEIGQRTDNDQLIIKISILSTRQLV